MANLTPADGVEPQAQECRHTVVADLRVMKDMPIVATAKFCCNCGAQLGGIMIKSDNNKMPSNSNFLTSKV